MNRLSIPGFVALAGFVPAQQFIAMNLRTGGLASGWRAADLDGDSDLDAVSFDAGGVVLLRNDGRGQFERTLIAAINTGISIGDVDGDADPDLVSSVNATL